MVYDIIFVIGETYFDHPLSGPAILKRLLEKQGFSVGIIETPKEDGDILVLGRPKLFFAVSSGSIDSMLRNYNALKRSRSEDPNIEINDEPVPDRAIIVFSNWIKKHFKESIIVIGGVEATLRRFSHYDYWDNAVRKPILIDSRADILSYGSSEKQILEIAQRLRQVYLHDTATIMHARDALYGIQGTCIISRVIPPEFTVLPSHTAILESKEQFCVMQNLFSNTKNLAQPIDTRAILQYAMPTYLPQDLDEYYSLPFTRQIPDRIKYLRGFEFSVVTHRGCIGRCNFCSLTLTQGDKIISRSEESILNELRYITTLPHFKGNIDDFGGPSANMYGMDCIRCEKVCLECKQLPLGNTRLLALLKRARSIPGITHIYVRSGVRFDLCSDDYIAELATHHVADTLRIAPEHVDKEILDLMYKDFGNLEEFMKKFHATGKKLSFYFMTAHPGSTLEHAKALAAFTRKHKNTESIQIFTPTPMTDSTCMYYTGLNPKTLKKVYVPYTYSEKKEQKKVAMP